MFSGAISQQLQYFDSTVYKSATISLERFAQQMITKKLQTTDHYGLSIENLKQRKMICNKTFIKPKVPVENLSYFPKVQQNS